mgnify:CR=1 FL=1
MAIRPVYVPLDIFQPGSSLVAAHEVQFDWHAGFSVAQKRRSIQSLAHLGISSRAPPRGPPRRPGQQLLDLDYRAEVDYADPPYVDA